MRLYSLFCVMVLLCSFDHINFRKLPSLLQLVTMKVRSRRKKFATFVKDDCKYTTKWLRNKCQIQAANEWDFWKTPYRFTKRANFNRKSQVNTKLGEAFYYLPYLDICKSQNVIVNTYYNFVNKLVCLSELLYRNNMDMFAFLMVVWQNLQYENPHSQRPCAANFWDLDLSTILPWTWWVQWCNWRGARGRAATLAS